jgi:DNA processing protein
VDDLFPPAESPQTRSRSPLRELGAYEALWLREPTTFRSIARLFRDHPGALPSEFVSQQEAATYERAALERASAAGTGTFAVCLHGMREYPERLRSAASPVELLYYQGRWELLSGRCLAIIGTRHPSVEGEVHARQLARHFAPAGFTILSGLARGIDTAAHVAAIESGGATAAVLGTPLTACFPPGNEVLQRRLAREHLVVSQVPILCHARRSLEDNRAFFRERNATLAALAEAIVIVEAGEHSGALIAARHALEQGRQVFLLESCLRRSKLTWPARLLGRGAVCVRRLAEIESRLAP